jgi:hypothetical protein
MASPSAGAGVWACAERGETHNALGAHTAKLEQTIQRFSKPQCIKL